MRIDVYDFDGTIYDGDSTVDFTRFCLRRHPTVQDERTRAKLGRWFFDRPRDLPIVIASASPEFELQYAAKILGVPRLIGTKCDAETGALIGKNCKGEEKLRRIGEAVGAFEIRAMYTDDAKADGPLLAAAQEGYIVTHGVLVPFRG